MTRKLIVVTLALSSAFLVAAQPPQGAETWIDVESGVVHGQATVTTLPPRSEWKVEARGNESSADPGDADVANIAVLVTRQGLPVTNLSSANFLVRTLHVALGATCTLEVDGFSNLGVGAYSLPVRPTTCTWHEGRYIVQVIAHDNAVAAGHALAEFDVR